MAYVLFAGNIWRGQSTDTKPNATTYAGHLLVEENTGKHFQAAGGVWVRTDALPTHVTLSTGATAMAAATNSSVKVTPNANATYTTTVPAAGLRFTILILTYGTTSRTITFGSGFKSVGTLATGTVTARVFAISFISDGTNLYETGRTIAMVA